MPNPSRLDIDQDKLLTHLRWYRSHLVDYARFRAGDEGFAIEGLAAEEITPIDAALDEVVSRTFALERDLQAALRRDLGQLEPGLKIEDDGSERRVEAGFIDILARDAAGVLTVIELKAETTRPDAVAQLLGYMACVSDEDGEPVRGILIGADHHPRVTFAVRALPNVQIKTYRFRFDFS